MNPAESKCPVCGGTWLEEGGFARGRHRFFPSRVAAFFGYRVLGYVCVDCGFLGHYLEESDLEKLRHKLRGFSRERK